MKFWLATILLITVMLLPEETAGAFDLFNNETASISDYRLYIKNFYIFAISASILIATVFIMIGGVIWITSAGNQSRIGKAQEYIKHSLTGIVLLMGAYVILAVVNPNLVSLKKIDFPPLIVPGACITGGGTAANTVRIGGDTEKPKEGKAQTNPSSEKGTKCTDGVLNEEACKGDFIKGKSCAELIADIPCSEYKHNYDISIGKSMATDSCSRFCAKNSCTAVLQLVNDEAPQLVETENGFDCVCAKKGEGSLSTGGRVVTGACTIGEVCNNNMTRLVCERTANSQRASFTFKGNATCSGADTKTTKSIYQEDCNRYTQETNGNRMSVPWFANNKVECVSFCQTGNPYCDYADFVDPPELDGTIICYCSVREEPRFFQ